MDEIPPSKALPYLISLVSGIGGAILMYWSVADRMERQITEKVNLVSRVSELGAQVVATNRDINNLRADLNEIRGRISSQGDKSGK